MEAIFYVIDLDRKSQAITEFYGEELEKDLKFFNKKDPMDLADFDRKIFKTAEKAEQFKEVYNAVSEKLPLLNLKRDFNLPCMLYKRRYIIQTILGIKLYTIRSYKKNWQKGQLFQFHDQVFFLTVKLKEITSYIDNGRMQYRYDFELIK